MDIRHNEGQRMDTRGAKGGHWRVWLLAFRPHLPAPTSPLTSACTDPQSSTFSCAGSEFHRSRVPIPYPGVGVKRGSGVSLESLAIAGVAWPVALGRWWGALGCSWRRPRRRPPSASTSPMWSRSPPRRSAPSGSPAPPPHPVHPCIIVSPYFVESEMKGGRGPHASS